jgi:sec-independent protein translocase protein TatC
MEELEQQLLQYGPYMEEIRRRLYRLAIVFAGVFLVAFAAAGYIVALPIKLFHLPHVIIAVSSPFQYVTLSMDVGLFFAFLVLLPMFIYQLYSFLKSALTQREQKLFKRFIPLMFVLFLVGFCYGIGSMYIAFVEMAKLNTSIGLTNVWDVGKFLSQMILTSTLLGLLFEAPVILTILIRLDFVQVSYLIKKQRYAVVAIVAFVCLLPPTDALSITLMSIPLIVIYYATIFINRGYRPSRPRAETNQLIKEKIYV